MSFQVRIGITNDNATNGTGTEGTDYIALPISSTYKTTSTTLVDNARNADGYVVGTVIRAGIRKIEMSWRVMTLADYAKLSTFFINNFFFYAYYFDQDSNSWLTKQFYVGDRVADSLQQEQWTQNTGVGGGIAPKHIENFALSLVEV